MARPIRIRVLAVNLRGRRGVVRRDYRDSGSGQHHGAGERDLRLAVGWYQQGDSGAARRRRRRWRWAAPVGGSRLVLLHIGPELPALLVEAAKPRHSLSMA